MDTHLPTARLGRTEMRLTRVGLGAWAIGGGGWWFAWGEQDDNESVAAIRHAVDSGVNWIDTAAVYGLGHSEEIVATALRGLPEADRPYVFTKAGVVWDDNEPTSKPARSANPASIRREVEDSLRRLQLERIDLYQVHWPSEDGTSLDEYWQTFIDLRQEGKIRAAGLSNHTRPQLERAETLGHVDCLQPKFSAIHREAASDLLPWCDEHDTGVIVYSPMASGLLTGAFSHARAANLGPDDWRATSADFTEPALQRNLALADTLNTIGQRHGVTAGAVAIAWTLSFRGVTAAIVGARHPDQVDGWLPAATVDLDGTDLDQIAAAMEQTGAGSGPVHPTDVGSP